MSSSSSSVVPQPPASARKKRAREHVLEYEQKREVNDMVLSHCEEYQGKLQDTFLENYRIELKDQLERYMSKISGNMVFLSRERKNEIENTVLESLISVILPRIPERYIPTWRDSNLDTKRRYFEYLISATPTKEMKKEFLPASTRESQLCGCMKVECDCGSPSHMEAHKYKKQQKLNEKKNKNKKIIQEEQEEEQEEQQQHEEYDEAAYDDDY
jgi:hypothetical protein